MFWDHCLDRSSPEPLLLEPVAPDSLSASVLDRYSDYLSRGHALGPLLGSFITDLSLLAVNVNQFTFRKRTCLAEAAQT